MPSVSKNQQKFMGQVYALKKGDINPSDASNDIKDAAKSMSKKDAKDFASTKHKNLPNRVKQEIYNRLKQEYAMIDNRHGGDAEMDENFPANWMQGRTSNQHTLLRGKKRKFDNDKANFTTKNSGQSDLDDESELTEVLMLPAASISGLLPKSVFSYGDIQGKKESNEIIRDLVNTLNGFYKKHNMNRRIK